MIAVSPSTVLFLAANPASVPSLKQDEEFRAIENEIRSAAYRDRIRLRSRWAVRLKDLLQALNEDNPSVIHFSGHGAGERGLCFQADDGDVMSVSAETLWHVLSSAGSGVAVVVLSACFSEVQARAIVSRVPCVIGMSGAIADEAAICYSTTFYGALANGKSVATAHQQGLMMLATLPQGGQLRDVTSAIAVRVSAQPPEPKLLTRPGTDAAQVFVVTPASTRGRCELRIRATLQEFDAATIARVTEVLREITGDVTLQITDIKEGSVRLSLSLTPLAAKRLLELHQEGSLEEICGFRVVDVFEMPEGSTLAEGAKTTSQPAQETHRQLTVDRLVAIERAPGRHQKQGEKSVRNPDRGGYSSGQQSPALSARVHASDRIDVRIGELLGSYQIVELIGQGGMGVVYAGRHVQFGHRVAVKVLRSEMSHNPDVVRRFFNEAQAVTAIRSPGVVQVFDFGTTANGCTYLVMELLEGVSLGTRLKERQLDMAECCRLTRQIANVLQAAHTVGIMHRDLKPDNLFLIPDTEVVGGERVKVLDFGIAKAAGKVRIAGKQVRAYPVTGTPSYMSPEQCRGVGAIDPCTDIYSLGCVLFEMVCGRPPFVGMSTEDIIGAHLQVPPPSLLDFAPNAPPALAALVARMLEKQPAARPQTMMAVSMELDEILRQISDSSRASTGLASSSIVITSSLPLLSTTSLGSSLSTTLATPRSDIAADDDEVPRRLSPRLSRRPDTVWTHEKTMSTTLGGAVGVANGPVPSSRQQYWPLLIGLLVVGLAVSIALLVSMVGWRPDARERETHFSGFDTGSASGLHTSLAGGGTVVTPSEVDVLESECSGFQVDHRWTELAQCARKLAQIAPQRATALKDRAARELKTAPDVEAVAAALRARDLRRASEALGQVWADSLELPELKKRYAAAESQAAAELAGRLGRAMSPTCTAYQELLAKERAVQLPSVITEATRFVPCTPVIRGSCNAKALAEEGRARHAAGKLVPALWSYEASWYCQLDPQTAKRGFIVACNIPNAQKAKQFWKRMPVEMRPTVVASCVNNRITEQQLNVP
jgi:serine/threonine protein kinase